MLRDWPKLKFEEKADSPIVTLITIEAILSQTGISQQKWQCDEKQLTAADVLPLQRQ
ncbi:hypothetical protein [Paenibacillus paridis]|uniref:hypothetical protein n=1 Tax=Paenibacillus paridis TaxID=2583376 RepID=UPI001391079C|nr:hypothetical protein [Paenibacillus paridis]